MKFENFLPRPRIGEFPYIRYETRHVQELRHRGHFIGLLVDHQGGADAAVRMAAATDLAPLGLRTMHQVREVREGGHQRKREPVARGLGKPRLLFHVMGQMRERVALLHPPLRSDFLIPTREGDRLESHEGDLSGVFAGEIDDRPHLVVVDVVDQRDDQNDFDTGRVEVLNGAELDVEQVADLAMAVRVVADAVELQVGVAEARFKGAVAVGGVLGKLDTVRGRLHAVEAELARIANRVDEVGRHGRFAARELHRHLTPRLDLHGVVENLFDVFPGQLMDESHLVRVHEAGVRTSCCSGW